MASVDSRKTKAQSINTSNGRKSSNLGKSKGSKRSTIQAEIISEIPSDTGSSSKNNSTNVIVTASQEMESTQSVSPTLRYGSMQSKANNHRLYLDEDEYRTCSNEEKPYRVLKTDDMNFRASAMIKYAAIVSHIYENVHVRLAFHKCERRSSDHFTLYRTDDDEEKDTKMEPKKKVNNRAARRKKRSYSKAVQRKRRKLCKDVAKIKAKKEQAKKKAAQNEKMSKENKMKSSKASFPNETVEMNETVSNDGNELEKSINSNEAASAEVKSLSKQVSEAEIEITSTVDASNESFVENEEGTEGSLMQNTEKHLTLESGEMKKSSGATTEEKPNISAMIDSSQKEMLTMSQDEREWEDFEFEYSSEDFEGKKLEPSEKNLKNFHKKLMKKLKSEVRSQRKISKSAWKDPYMKYLAKKKIKPKRQVTGKHYVEPWSKRFLRFKIYQEAFSSLVIALKAYEPILGEIQDAYDEVLNYRLDQKKMAQFESIRLCLARKGLKKSLKDYKFQGALMIFKNEVRARHVVARLKDQEKAIKVASNLLQKVEAAVSEQHEINRNCKDRMKIVEEDRRRRNLKNARPARSELEQFAEENPDESKESNVREETAREEEKEAIEMENIDDMIDFDEELDEHKRMVLVISYVVCKREIEELEKKIAIYAHKYQHVVPQRELDAKRKALLEREQDIETELVLTERFGNEIEELKLEESRIAALVSEHKAEKKNSV